MASFKRRFFLPPKIFAISNIYLPFPNGVCYNSECRIRAKAEVIDVGVSYNKLFKLLIDKNMKKGELCEAASVSPSSLAKLRNGENVNTDILVRICKTLHCEPGDIMELSCKE